MVKIILTSVYKDISYHHTLLESYTHWGYSMGVCTVREREEESAIFNLEEVYNSTSDLD